MKRGIIAIILLICLSSSVFAAGLTRSIPERATQGEEVDIQLQIEGATIYDKVVVAELLPEGVEVTDWYIVGATEEVSRINLIEKGDERIWEFTAAKTNPTIVYTITLPEQGEDARFDAVYALPPDLFGNDKARITLLPPIAPETTLAAPIAVSPSESPLPSPDIGGPLSALLVSGFILVVLGLVMFRLTEFGHHQTRIHRHHAPVKELLHHDGILGSRHGHAQATPQPQYEPAAQAMRNHPMTQQVMHQY